MCWLVCEGGLLILNLQRLFSRATRGPLQNGPCHPDLSLSSPAIFIVCRVVPAQKAPRYDDDFMKIARGRRRKKGLRIVRI
jgi:hypothetical protein